MAGAFSQSLPTINLPVRLCTTVSYCASVGSGFPQFVGIHGGGVECLCGGLVDKGHRRWPKQGRGDPRSHCGYTQGRNISGSFCVNLDPYHLQAKKLWYIHKVLRSRGYLVLLQN